jgi:iron complex outermembrane receptor protein
MAGRGQGISETVRVWVGPIARAWASVFVFALGTTGIAFRNQNAHAAPAAPGLPQITITSPKAKPAHSKKPKAGSSASSAAQLVPPAGSATALSANSTTPFGLPAALDKTGTPIGNVPRSIQIVPHELFERQGATVLGDVLRDVSGAGQGGQFAFGFYDRFFIRGLNANFLSDGFPDSTSDLTGIPHTLTGVERVEVLKGPGSALYGSSEPGGTINLVHYLPTGIPSASVSEQIGSFGTTTTDISATGPATIANLDWRVDGRYGHSDGFRGQQNEVAEILPTLRWRPPDHDFVLRFEYRHIDLTPDASGIPFSPPKGAGLPLPVPTSYTYYTPFAEGDQDITRVYGSDAWTVSDLLVLNTKTSFSNRMVDILRNAGGSVTPIGNEYGLANRQLREQNDDVNDFIYQFEPTWHFLTGNVRHVLITGVETRSIDVESARQTANLPNIANIYAPVVPEQSLSQLRFLCAAGNSCYNDHLWARYNGVYAIDQMDVTDAWKVRLSARQNWFTTAGEANTSSPVNPGNVYPCPSMPAGCPFMVGVPVTRTDTPFSWDAGTVYYLRKDLSVFAGYSDSYYPIFNTEEPQTVAQAPEHGTEYEAGVRYQLASMLTLATAVFQATRQNVFNLTTVANPIGPGNIDVAEFFNYRVTGWETDLTATPTDRWIINANLTLQNPRITSYPPTPANVGNFVPSVPSMLANAWITYLIAMPQQLGPLKASVGVRYRNGEYSDVGNTRDVPGTPLFDAALEETIRNVTWRLGVNNIFDRSNYVYAAGTGGGAFPGPGRTAYLRVTAKW